MIIHSGMLPALVVTCLAALPLLTACQPPTTAADMETIGRGAHSGIMTREQLVIASPDEWEEFWSRHASLQLPPPILPEVDFSAEMVIAVFSGEKPTGGYSVEISEVEFAEDEVNIFFEEVSPVPGEPVTEALTQPFHIIKISRIEDLPVKFISR